MSDYLMCVLIMLGIAGVFLLFIFAAWLLIHSKPLMRFLRRVM
jgi:hypothetical protein